MAGKEMRRSRRLRAALVLSLVLAQIVSLIAPAAAPAFAASTIVSRGAATMAKYGPTSTTSLLGTAPAGAQAGDVLIASVGYGKATATSLPAITPPSGWTLATRTDQGTVGTLAVYWHVFAAGESSYTWTTDTAVGGVVLIAAFGGVDTTNPIDDAASVSDPTGGRSFWTPSVTTTVANAALVASYFATLNKSATITWSVPSGMTELGDVGIAGSGTSGSRAGSLDWATQATPGASGQKNAVTSTALTFGIMALAALRPAGSGGGGVSSAPVISNVAAGSVATTGATITWTTDQASDSQVEYGTTTAYGSSTTLNTSMVTGHSQALASLTAGTLYHYRVKSKNAAAQLATSGDFTFTTTAAAGGPVPLIVDTDIFSDADDVGALATAFGLQVKNEARVIAIGINTRTSRPAVATNSWKCAAAVAQFYNSGSIPIGTAMPNNGTALNTVDFVGPCSGLASPSTPAPDTAVNVFRRALVGQADGSVVIAEAGYSQNLSALLNSPADGISPLSGRDLVAQKVSTLVIMAGGYPSRNGENNLIGDPASAQNVADNWPTKVVWSGYEVGDAIHTGNTISSKHPTNSPVRVSYEAFVGPNNWIYSYDLTAVYHAVRPGDTAMTLVGPGKNTVTSTGANSFALGAGNQYYLKLNNATGLDASIEALLDTLPSSTPTDTTPPVISAVSAGSVTNSGATITWTTNENSDSQVEYGITTAYGSSTTLNTTIVTSHSQTLTGLTAGTLYHYRVKSKDAAGNLATSGDTTFTTLTSAPAGPNDTFDTNTIDPARWTVTQNGSTVAATNQMLQITHPAGAWTSGSVDSVTPHDQRGRSLQLQVKRAANDGLGGSTYGETSIYLWLDATHYAYFFVAGGSLTVWVNSGSGETNLTPGWPAYSATSMQWVRFREAGGTLYFEYASGATSPGTWGTLASTPDPFAMNAVTLKIAAGANVNASDAAQFDNVSTQ